MNDTNDVIKSVEEAEVLDTQLQDEGLKLDELQGTLEAVAVGALTAEEPQKLTPHQQEMVDSYKALQHEHKGQIFGVMDKAATEAYVDNRGNLHMDGEAPRVALKKLPAPLTDEERDTPGEFTDLVDQYGPNVFGAISVHGIVVPANEGFLDFTSSLFRKLTTVYGKQVPVAFKAGAKALKHYVELADRLKKRLLQLRPLVADREFPMADVFDYGAYPRFFMVSGKSIGLFSEFEEAMTLQNLAIRHTFNAAQGYAVSLAEKLLGCLQQLQAHKEPNADHLAQLRDSVALLWEVQWKDADLTTKPGQTPQVAINAFPDRKFVSLAPMLDNRYLVAFSPKKDGGQDPGKIVEALKHYGATVVFDKAAGKPTQHSMNVPNIDDLLKMIDETVHILTDFRAFEELAEKGEDFAKDFGKAMDVLAKVAPSFNDPQYQGFVAEYFKIVGAVTSAIHQPYANMAWMYIRCAMVVASLAELACLESGPQQVVTSRFFAKQNTEFSNPAMESYAVTCKVLQAAQRAPA